MEPVAKLMHGNWNEELAHLELLAVFSTSGACQSRLDAVRRWARRGGVCVAQHVSRSDALHKNRLSPKVSALFAPSL